MLRKLYFIDSSCDEKVGGNFDRIVRECMRLSDLICRKITNPNDTDFARVYNVIFKTPKTDKQPFPHSNFYIQQNGPHCRRERMTSLQHVLRVHLDFAHKWERTYCRERADVRIYCDNGRRWKMTRKKTTFVDPVNHMMMVGDWAALVRGHGFTVVSTTKAPKGENPNRCTIDICDAAWDNSAFPDYPRTLSELSQMTLPWRKILNLSKLCNIDDLGNHLITRVVFHEFMHCSYYLLDDPPEGRPSAGWAAVMAQKKGKAAATAESHAYFALFAGLSEIRPTNQPCGGYGMGRRWDRIRGSTDHYVSFPGDDGGTKKWDIKHGWNKAVRGEISFYHDITNA
ncbi:hypothetical protein QBC46DRAFT_432631 [Diplogelasinospora grovesii]|uniref:Uncharacterized protein n=1 Tax=Diplogelasinospora grovesii TaxID=303347 RepID=A0AAN6N8H8_9PEZI|nr:hypothetical protein QBC46DRAFT_432631 [Diplogelasinospora grovesii]